MAAEVLGAARERVAATSVRVIGGSAVGARGAMHSPYSLVAAAHKRAVEAANKADEVRARKVARAEKAARRARVVTEALAARQDLIWRVCKRTRHRSGAGWLVSILPCGLINVHCSN